MVRAGEATLVIAVDTNVILRLVVMDDARQLELARRIFDAQAIYVPAIALLEAVWVLTRIYGYSRDAILQAIDALLAVGSVTLENEAQTLWALSRYSRGADLADMLLLVASREQTAFATFDGQLARRAGDDTPVPVQLLS